MPTTTPVATQWPGSQAIPRRFPVTVQDLFNYVGRLYHDAQIRCVIRMVGRIDAERLALAFRLTLDAEPVLGCRLVEHPLRPLFERRPDLAELPLCPVVETGNVEAQLWEFATAPADARVGPLVHARLFRDETDTLCVKVDHTAADGVGAIQYLSLLAATYRELAKNADYRPPYQGHLNRGQWAVFRRIGPMGTLASFQAMRGIARGFPHRSLDRSQPAFAVRRLDADCVQAIRAYGRRHGATFNDLLVAALYRAYFATLDQAPTEPCLLTLPVNLHPYLPPDQPFPVMNLSGGNLFGLACQPEEHFEGTLVRVQAISGGFKRTYPGVMGALLSGAWFTPGFAFGRWTTRQLIGRQMSQGKMAPFLSNVGIIDDQVLDFGQPMSEVFGLGVISFPPGINIAASTFQGVLTLTAGYCASATEPAVVQGFLDQIVHELVNASGATIDEARAGVLLGA